MVRVAKGAKGIKGWAVSPLAWCHGAAFLPALPPLLWHPGASNAAKGCKDGARVAQVAGAAAAAAGSGGADRLFELDGGLSTAVLGTALISRDKAEAAVLAHLRLLRGGLCKCRCVRVCFACRDRPLGTAVCDDLMCDALLCKCRATSLHSPRHPKAHSLWFDECVSACRANHLRVRHVQLVEGPAQQLSQILYSNAHEARCLHAPHVQDAAGTELQGLKDQRFKDSVISDSKIQGLSAQGSSDQ